MPLSEPKLTVGIEEEYLLVDRASRELAIEPPEAMFSQCEALLEGRVTPEFLRAQIEVATHPSATVREARADLAHLRATVAKVADDHGLAPIAASTHPFARWQEQQFVEKHRYQTLARDLQAVARRLLICGMHIHIGVDDDDLRIDLMNQMSYFLPHLLALTTSSPFWAGEDTGLKSYRLTVFDALPRTGLPDRYESFGEYQRVVKQLVQGGLMEDATKLWWDLRPSARFPTLEMRICDVCTRLDDAVTVAALTQCIISMLFRLRGNNQRWRLYPRILVHENRWLAQRYGVGGELVDFGKGVLVPYADLIDELIALVREDAERLGCLAEVEHAREIAAHGTSADRQRRAYEDARAGGADQREALEAVVDFLIEETLRGVEAPNP
ncbi:MAG: carboxylate-amine ligase [Proteobacteria bacterium]|nr:carboxylate-amine ligase [Pseudomonadota bacterium]